MGERITESLPVKLTSAEVQEKSDELAELMVTYTKLEARKKEEAARYSEQLKEIRESMDELADEVKHRRVFRVVECHERVRHETRVTQIVRNDTGEVISERPSTDKELQLELLQ